MNGIFIISELSGDARARVREVHAQYDPRLAACSVPHITITGSSGVGPLSLDTPVDELRQVLIPIAASTAPIELRFGPATRFMQTDILVLPLDPHGALRALHERIATSGLRFAPSRFPFSPHCTLSFFPTLTQERRRELLAVRLDDPVTVTNLQLYQTEDPLPARRILEMELGRAGSGQWAVGSG